MARVERRNGSATRLDFPFSAFNFQLSIPFMQQHLRYLARIEAGIDSMLPTADTPPARLHAAMRYAMQGGGKRLRPMLVLAAADVFPGRPGAADPLPAALAVECVHTYSLIHDDLPCMDNDDLRRGRPTAHKAFDEATALLAGDALLTEAFALLSNNYAPNPGLAMELTRELAEAAGSRRLIGGQMADLLAERVPGTSPAGLEFIHLNKTAAMIGASLAMGGACAAAGRLETEALRTAGRHLGLAFQIIDDVLDATSDSATLGKTAGKDARAGKATYATLHGIEAARGIAGRHTSEALATLRSIAGDTAFLITTAEELLERLR
jgi:geranylgeranyl pyrophosphate synthase